MAVCVTYKGILVLIGLRPLMTAIRAAFDYRDFWICVLIVPAAAVFASSVFRRDKPLPPRLSLDSDARAKRPIQKARSRRVTGS